jgi:hypothetical protein
MMMSYSPHETPRPHVANPALNAELSRYERTPIIERNAPFEPGAERPVRSPIQRLAGLLTAISRNNAYEGRDPRYVPDTLTAAFVGSLLALDLEDLSRLLGVLEYRGLVALGPTKGLWLLDIPAIERLAD